MDVKGWLFRNFLADSLIKRAYAALDGYCAKRWPLGWPRIQFAMGGWVTKLGVGIAGTAGGALWLADYLRQGGYPDHALKVGYYAGIFIVTVGLVRKAMKWLIYEEAIDHDNWLDDEKAPKPEGLDPNEKALVQGKLADVKADLADAQKTVGKAEAVVKKAGP